MSNNLYVNKPLVGLFFTMQFFVSTLFAANQYVDYGEQVLSGQKSIKQAPTKPNKKDKKSNPKLKALQEGLSPLDPFAKTQLVFKELSKHSSVKTQSTIVSTQAVKDLSLLQGDATTSGHKSRLFSVFNNTATVFGQAGLARLLAEPLCDVVKLKQRQAVMRTLVEDEQVLEACQILLEEISEGEQLFLGYFGIQTNLDKKVYNHVYFPESLSRLNTAPAALEILRAIHYAWNGLGFMPIKYYFNTMGKAFLDAADGEYTSIPLAPFKALWPTIKQEIAIHDPRLHVPRAEQMFEDMNQTGQLPDFPENPTFRDSVEISFITSARFRQELQLPPIEEYEIPSIRRTQYMVSGGLELIAHLIWFLRARSAAKSISFEHEIMRSIQTRMIGVAQVIRGMKDLYQLAKNGKLAQRVPQFAALEKLFGADALISDELQQLLNLVQTNTLQGTASVMSFMGHALAAHKLMQEVKADLMPAIEAVGMIDALVSAALVYKAQKNSALPWSFAEFIEHEKPVLAFTNLCNPLVDQKVSVAQDITFDETQAHHMLITGPHGCGKSTIMKAVAYGVICAQVFGIVPAQAAQLTPIDTLITYMNVREEIGEAKSTFMAELERLETIKSELEKASDKKVLCLVDELFKGTMEAEGGHRLYEFMQCIQDKTNTISMIATHFEEPTKIESEAPSCANYYVGLDEPREGQFIRRFTLHKGKNPWWFTDTEKRKRFITWLRDIKINETK